MQRIHNFFLVGESIVAKKHAFFYVQHLWTSQIPELRGYNQDKHRQQLVDWVNATGKKSTATWLGDLLGGGFKHFLIFTLFGEDSHFD